MDDDLSLPPLLLLVFATVPDAYGSAAVLSFWDNAFEAEVRNRVVLRLDSEPSDPLLLRRPLRDRPALQDVIALQSQVPVEGAGVVLLDDEPFSFAGLNLASGLRGLGEIALRPVLLQAHVLDFGSGSICLFRGMNVTFIA